jgi:hypothetical protein
MKYILSLFVCTGILISCFYHVLPAAIHAQESSIELSIDKDTVEEGEPFQVLISITREANEITPRDIEIDGIEQFGQVGESISTEIRIVNGQVYTATVIAKSLVISESGDFTIGPARVEILNENGETEVLESNEGEVAVQPIAAGVRPTNTPLPTRQVQQITLPPDFTTPPPVETEQPPEETDDTFVQQIIEIIYFGLIALLIVLLGRVVYLWIRNHHSSKTLSQKDKSRETQHFSSPHLSIPPTDDAQFFQKGRTNLIRYLEEKHSLTLQKHTTNEVLRILRDKDIAHYADIKFVLEMCDWNKYAKGDEGKEEIVERMRKIG